MSVRLSLRDLYALAYIDGLHRKSVRPVTDPSQRIRLDDTGRAPIVPLRPTGGDPR